MTDKTQQEVRLDLKGDRKVFYVEVGDLAPEKLAEVLENIKSEISDKDSKIDFDPTLAYIGPVGSI